MALQAEKSQEVSKAQHQPCCRLRHGLLLALLLLLKSFHLLSGAIEN
jgi:hypothetical protein